MNYQRPGIWQAAIVMKEASQVSSILAPESTNITPT